MLKHIAGEPGDFRGSSWRSRYEIGMVPQVQKGVRTHLYSIFGKM